MKYRTFRATVHLKSGKTFKTAPLPVKGHHNFINDVEAGNLYIDRMYAERILSIHTLVIRDSEYIEATTLKKSAVPFYVAFAFWWAFGSRNS